jgi:hypothetical protein
MEKMRGCVPSTGVRFMGGEWGKATGHALGAGLRSGSADGGEDGEYERELHGERQMNAKYLAGKT